MKGQRYRRLGLSESNAADESQGFDNAFDVMVPSDAINERGGKHAGIISALLFFTIRGMMLPRENAPKSTYHEIFR